MDIINRGAAAAVAKKMDLIGVFLLLLVIDIVYYTSHLCRTLSDTVAQTVLTTLLSLFNVDS